MKNGFGQVLLVYHVPIGLYANYNERHFFQIWWRCYDSACSIEMILRVQPLLSCPCLFCDVVVPTRIVSKRQNGQHEFQVFARSKGLILFGGLRVLGYSCWKLPLEVICRRVTVIRLFPGVQSVGTSRGGRPLLRSDSYFPRNLFQEFLH